MKAEELNILHLTTKLRAEMMDLLTDSDLAFRIPNNPTLGELCREMGDVERSYIDSFKTLKQVWDVKNTEPGLDGSIEKLKAWYKALDTELDTVLSAIPDADLQTKMVDRGFPMPLGGQFHTYREALLIFCGKCSVYLRAMGKPLGEQFQGWIG
jgi:DinB family protein